ncbi:hypothetical protein [Helicobacter felis]|uniref:Periplasmic competence protein n=1 Tax=Helicobacter felis (strain ATCC 49179 / CCUG 28539 / NCTC 12436 / CS1) TaxID=936155 RepID=E7ADA9_HELFC|nr:hypothetical protein [Helicobacter felis]CBY83166.1 periplasmic competence protein [Helicobacter felis ATCC 49179]
MKKCLILVLFLCAQAQALQIQLLENLNLHARGGKFRGYVLYKNAPQKHLIVHGHFQLLGRDLLLEATSLQKLKPHTKTLRLSKVQAKQRLEKIPATIPKRSRVFFKDANPQQMALLLGLNPKQYAQDQNSILGQNRTDSMGLTHTTQDNLNQNARASNTKSYRRSSARTRSYRSKSVRSSSKRSSRSATSRAHSARAPRIAHPTRSRASSTRSTRSSSRSNRSSNYTSRTNPTPQTTLSQSHNSSTPQVLQPQNSYTAPNPYTPTPPLMPIPNSYIPPQAHNASPSASAPTSTSPKNPTTLPSPSTSPNPTQTPPTTPKNLASVPQTTSPTPSPGMGSFEEVPCGNWTYDDEKLEASRPTVLRSLDKASGQYLSMGACDFSADASSGKTGKITLAYTQLPDKIEVLGPTKTTHTFSLTRASVATRRCYKARTRQCFWPEQTKQEWSSTYSTTTTKTTKTYQRPVQVGASAPTELVRLLVEHKAERKTDVKIKDLGLSEDFMKFVEVYEKQYLEDSLKNSPEYTQWEKDFARPGQGSCAEYKVEEPAKSLKVLPSIKNTSVICVRRGDYLLEKPQS